MKAYIGIRGITPLILTLDTRWRYNPTVTLRPFAHRKGFLFTLGEPWKRSQLFGEEKYLLSLPAVEPQLLSCPPRSLANKPATLSWLPFGKNHKL